MGISKGLVVISVIRFLSDQDTKPNVLIGPDSAARIGDFGLTMIIDESTSGSTPSGHELRGTTRWMAPELLYPEYFGFPRDCQKRLPSKSTDIYALGMTVLEVCVPME